MEEEERSGTFLFNTRMASEALINCTDNRYLVGTGMVTLEHRSKTSISHVEQSQVNSRVGHGNECVDRRRKMNLSIYHDKERAVRRAKADLSVCHDYCNDCGGGGFFLACEDLGRMFDYLFSACTIVF